MKSLRIAVLLLVVLPSTTGHAESSKEPTKIPLGQWAVVACVVNGKPAPFSENTGKGKSYWSVSCPTHVAGKYTYANFTCDGGVFIDMGVSEDQSKLQAKCMKQ